MPADRPPTGRRTTAVAFCAAAAVAAAAATPATAGGADPRPAGSASAAVRAAGPAGSWAAPVPGRVAGAFRFDRTAPFARGARRGVDLAATAGEPVRAACAGRVTHAGRTPHGHGVTLRCGRLAATHLRVARLAVRRGQRVRRGAVLGAAAGPVLRLGARWAADRHGYVDPLVLMRDPTPGAPALPAPRPRSPRRLPRVGRHAVPRIPRPAVVREPVVRGRAPRPRGSMRPGPAPAAARPGTPPLAWVGLALAGVALPTGALVRRRARRSPSRRPVPTAGRRLP